MRRRFRARLSPALLVALIALFVAMGGVSYGLASNTVGTNAIKNNSIRTQDIRNGTLRNRDIRRGNTIDASRLKEAYGFVSSAGVADNNRSRNITATRITTGRYCVTPNGSSHINPAKSQPAVSADFQDGAGSFHTAEVDSDGDPACPVGNGWTVRTFNTAANGVPTFRNIAFSIVVPTGAG